MEGLFEKEIIPVEITKKDPETGATSRVIVTKDDVIRFVPWMLSDFCYWHLLRHGTELATLLKIRSAFPHWAPSQTTGGNASQNSDGAAAVLLMTRITAEELGLKILAKYVATR
jgi:acetyl-CoA acyltransferase 1